MQGTFLRVKGIIKNGENVLLLKRWVDDRIPEPFLWEFVDGEVMHGESPDSTVLNCIRDSIGVEGNIEKIVYTWSQLLGDTHCVGIAYECSADDESQFILPEEIGEYRWVPMCDISKYIDNRFVIADFEKAYQNKKHK